MAAIVRSSGRAWLCARRAFCALLVVAALAGPATSLAETPPITLPDGRGLDPAGRMVSAGDFPAAALMLPGHGVLVDTTGSQINQLEAFNAQTLASEGAATPVAAISTNAAFWAQTGHLALAPDGATLYAAGGATDSVDSFKLPPAGPPLQTGTISTPGFAGGVAVSRDGSHIFVTVPFDSSHSYDKGSRLVRLGAGGAVDGSATTGSVPWDLTAGMAHGRELVITADRDGSTVSVFDAGTLALIRRIAVGRSPAAPTLTPDGTLLVLSTLDDTLSEVDPLSGQHAGFAAVEPDSKCARQRAGRPGRVE
jgi:DNA-binding beta-propeller fold protein YncE